MTESVIPFRIDVPQVRLDELRARLDAMRWPAPLPGDDWDSGVPAWWLRDMVDYWRTGYDWRAIEQQLNAYPGFVTEIDGQRIHFLHIRSAEPDALPLILTHGWPGSFVEFLDMIGPLTDPVAHGGDRRDAFHVVLPSLPGFAFSGPGIQPDWDNYRTARAWAELMTRLGYDRFGVQGGDAGGAVSPLVAQAAPDRVVGVHLNGAPAPMPPGPLTEAEIAGLSEREQQIIREMGEAMRLGAGYMAVQTTSPQTLAYAFTDSPVGQLAWIMEKFKAWTFPADALPDEVVDRDRLLTNVMLYWLNSAAGPSAYQTYHQRGGWGSEPNSGVPTGVINFAVDRGIRKVAETSHTITRWTEIRDRGGHFAALEEPELLTADIRAFFGSLRD